MSSTSNRARSNFISSLVKTGTEGLVDEESINRVVFVNSICLIIGALLLSIGPIVAYILHWERAVVVPVTIEFIINCAVIGLNHFKKYLTASLTLFCLQCAAILYFGFLLGDLFHLDFMIFFLIPVIFLIFKQRRVRNIALAFAIGSLIILQISYRFKPLHPAVVGFNTGYIIQSLIIGGTLILMLFVSKRYAQSNDSNPELKKANSLIKIFVAQVTHELRSSLDTIHHVTQLLKKEVGKDTYMKQIEPMLNISLTASTDARNIVNNVLDMAEIESGKMPGTANEAFPVRPFFEKILEVHSLTAREENIKLKLYIEEMPEVIISDPLNINQILTNLLGNAIKYGAKGGTINVEVKRRNNTWDLDVTNTGQGIPNENLNSIFDPFVTGKTGNIQGAGLGLYIVKSKVTSMNGTIRVQSNPGGYTIFSVTLPLIEGKLRNGLKQGEVAEDIADLSNIHVLMAEDRKFPALLLFRSLKEMGCKVTMVNNGLEVLHAAQKATPDVIILDLHMPVMNGEETVRQLKMIPALMHIPLIVTTGDLFSELLDNMMAAGADTYLEKPIDHATLQKTIMHYVQKRNS